ncbi:mannose-6-phosphate isomerase [Aequorivita sp. H23M31]|uniref:Phosphohexomutase n=1 Tax=Aequorivita ciconiae TaxID=2494375 RepID=A0A410G1N7_9FLAO|nr:type I phosphomannose isomerase catalytic subunit [Aequorivita sp. H23M31]QAA81187.1 mannose-6-phosphate isomerase [Aequorivita sp. H23M31]
MKETEPQLYPLKFKPILKEKVWGGKKLNNLLNKKATGNIGESWEISGVENNVSIVANGPWEGKSLDGLLSEFKEKLVGDRVYKIFGNKFPLLFKFIDAADDLSVQVHPEDSLAKQRHNSFGKTEMWHIFQADPGAQLIVGFKNELEKEDYLRTLAEGNITEILNSVTVKKGDTFVIYPGTVHAIGAGVLLAEIQQTSDITYRIYDWDRPEADGKMRELHTDLAVDAIDFGSNPKKESYPNKENFPVHIAETEFFSTNKLHLSQSFVRKLGDMDSFVVYMCLEGQATIAGNGFSEKMEIGDTLLIPAEIEEITFDTKGASFLEVYVP